MIHLVRRDYLVPDALIVHSDCLLGVDALVEEQVLDHKLLLPSVPDLQLPRLTASFFEV